MESQTKKTRSQLKREAIVEAAMAEFGEHGFDGVSMDRVASRAQVSKRTVYHHFESKQTLFDAITAMLMRRGERATALPYRADAPLDEQLMELARLELKLLRDTEYVSLVRMALSEFFHSPEFAQRALAKTKMNSSGIGVWIQEAVDDGRLRALDVEVATTQFAALLKAFAFWPQVLADGPPLELERGESIARSAVEMFLGHYGAE